MVAYETRVNDLIVRYEADGPEELAAVMWKARDMTKQCASLNKTHRLLVAVQAASPQIGTLPRTKELDELLAAVHAFSAKPYDEV